MGVVKNLSMAVDCRAQLGSKLNYFNLIKNIFGSDLLTFYLFDEIDGTTAVDSINNINANYSNVNLNQPGFGHGSKSVLLNSSASYIDYYSSSMNAQFPKSSGTIIFWLKTPVDLWEESTAYYLFKMYISDNYRIQIQKLVNKNYLYVLSKTGVRMSGGTYYYLHTNKWMCVAIRWDMATQTFDIFINGRKLLDTTTTALPFIGNLHTQFCTIGNDGKTGSSSFKGNVSSFALINRAATDAEIERSAVNDAFVLFEGDSRTTIDHRYADKTIDLIFNKNYSTANYALSGGTIADMVARGTTVDAQIRANTKNIIVLWTGVNDSSMTSQELFDALKSYCLSRKDAGWKVCICTEIDGQTTGLISNGWPEKYLALNQLLRANYHEFADDIIDFGNDVRLKDATNTDYFLADKLHPNYTFGADVLASIAAPIIAKF